MLARSVPATWLANTVGIVRPVASPIMLTMPVVLFQTMAPAAPAAWAFSALNRNSQPPRCIRAMEPVGMAAKSAASQPLLAPPGSTT